MDFTPHTTADIEHMLGAIGLAGLDDLFAHLPEGVRPPRPLDLPGPLAESEVMDLIAGYGEANRSDLVVFAGGGFYDHTVSPLVRALTMRPEFVTSYTPYQPEVSQGVLQALYEYQSMVTAITGLEVTNASLYDGATAAAEAMSLAVAATKRSTVWVSRALAPRTRRLLATMTHPRGIEIIEHPFVNGRTVWSRDAGPEPAALLFGQPNYLGAVEDYDDAVGLAGDLGALAVVSFDPITLGILRRPGDAGCDIAVAEGQPLGVPLSFGGPGVGIFAAKRKHLRRVPGRLVGRATDEQGRTSYVLTLRTREQDIRREKASSNICTNQSLIAINAGIQLAWLGPEGLREMARQSAQKAHYLAKRLEQLPGVALATTAPFVREFAITTPLDPADVIAGMAGHGFLAGVALSDEYPEFPGGLLVAVTERRSKAQLDGYVAALEEVVRNG